MFAVLSHSALDSANDQTLYKLFLDKGVDEKDRNYSDNCNGHPGTLCWESLKCKGCRLGGHVTGFEELYTVH